MIRELWTAFPQMMIQKINGLLDEAEPNPTRAFLIYKNCQSEGLWEDSFESFSKLLQSFFALPRSERKKSAFDRHLRRPMGMELYEKFHLTFRSAVISEFSLQEIASWAHHLVRVGAKTSSPVASEDVFQKVLHYITNPPHYEKDQNIEFEDFCQAWSMTVAKTFGTRFESEFQSLLREVRSHHQALREAEALAVPVAEAGGFFPTVYLTQTEIDWVVAVRKAADAGLLPPKFPLSRGPQKQALCELYGSIGLYKLVQNSDYPEFRVHRENLRTKILGQCEELLRHRSGY